ncbi:hypothetical protein H6G93_36155 [Nostoc sp. FACHB-973]|nr:hypothetical protein [Nostoc sp. FACHB-973]
MAITSSNSVEIYKIAAPRSHSCNNRECGYGQPLLVLNLFLNPQQIWFLESAPLAAIATRY